MASFSTESHQRAQAMKAMNLLWSDDKARPLDELLKSSEPLSGLESQMLRTFFTSNCMEPSRDLDSYGKMVLSGDLKGLKVDFEIRIQKSSHQVAVNQLHAMRWGPTRTPIFNCLLLATIIRPEHRAKHLDVVRWLISLGVPVDGRDLSGTTALSHSISTKPSFDPEFAQLLLYGGGDINNRNRYGATCAHDICTVWTLDSQKIARARLALTFFLDHAGDPNICDNDGCSPIKTLQQVPKLSEIAKIALERETIRKQEGCAFCGSKSGDYNAVQLLRCSRCKVVRYCAPPKGCQRADWKRHKTECKA